MKKHHVVPFALSFCLYIPMAAAQDAASPPAAEAIPGSMPEPAPAESAAGAAPGAAAIPEQTAGIEEIIVTAQKRQEAVNSVPMSITALSGNSLRDQGISSVGDLQKIVPGFRYTQSAYSTPIYSIRGIGFNESSLGAKPNVSVYVDEVPLPFPILTAGASMDLQRVEVLKGPQGTLFGQNSTGGAVNYIAAKPTDTFSAGFSDEYGSFNTSVIEGFVSGPLADTLKGRVAIKTEQGGDWQQSYTTDNENGKKNKTAARVLFDWAPSGALKAELNLNGYVDRSDEQAAQLIAITPLSQARVEKYTPDLLTYPTSPQDNRAADWGPSDTYSRDNRFVQSALRVDYELTQDLTLTSISSYSSYKQDRDVDPDGTTLQNIEYHTDGDIDSVNQELRLAGALGERTRWIVGANYAHDKVKQRDDGNVTYNGNAYALGSPPFFVYYNYSDQKFDTKSAFANVDFDLTDRLTAHAAARYTQADLDFSGCTGDSGDGSLATAWNRVFGTAVAAGDCTTTTLEADGSLNAGLKSRTLDENNLSWRTGLDWKPADGTLLYANISKGYKSGSFPILSASFDAQLDPATQESVLAYETGFKTRLLDRTMQFNGAVFYYDYKDKQVRGRVIDPVFGPLEALVNIPKSSVKGAELQLTWLPVAGLTTNVGGTYVDSEIKDFQNYDPYGHPGDFSGEAFPLTSKWQGFVDAQYEWPLNNDLNGFAGANLSYQSSTNGGLGDLDILKIDGYALLDLRAGVATADGKWRFSVWGRNLTDEYYWTIADHISDTTVRYTGMPTTVGVSVAYRYE
ncbi:MAG: hypothetical protein JWQ90_851 [Hydrocarboniphaga sp.]|uniref:TonB-dependent receptor n=1 Tax=Hydrocarboniphaga sp. TaxID=2033016 RepID=UPI002607CBE8|nr:TonB-dependent receptor [Hydrocarboniphaga sp.]MDB5968401.1 hypothetical protein [Hydrocarboniphaga sp.]